VAAFQYVCPSIGRYDITETDHSIDYFLSKREVFFAACLSHISTDQDSN